MKRIEALSISVFIMLLILVGLLSLEIFYQPVKPTKAFYTSSTYPECLGKFTSNLDYIADKKYKDNCNHKMKVFIYSPKQLENNDIRQLKKLGAEVNTDSWIPPTEHFDQGIMLGEIPIVNLNQICKLSFVTKVHSAEN